jgi:hypothetical protein
VYRLLGGTPAKLPARTTKEDGAVVVDSSARRS